MHGASVSRLPVFSGLPSLTASGLRAAGVRYSETHTDAAKMAAAAASTFELFGFESAVVPFDLCVEAEALGCHVDFQTDISLFLPPVVDSPLNRIPRTLPTDLAQSGRIPLVAQALRRLKEGVGREVAIGAWIPGPFTLAWQLFGATKWFELMRDTTDARSLLGLFGDWLARVAGFYRESGADFITVHEMGGSPQVVGPDNFRNLVKPPLKRLLFALPSPRVLSVCGDSNESILDLAECGADALNLDQRNDLARTRRQLPRIVLLGNLDPVETLSLGTPERVAQAVKSAFEAGANAIWPGCDLVPEIPDENMKALVESARQYSSYHLPRPSV